MFSHFLKNAAKMNTFYRNFYKIRKHVCNFTNIFKKYDNIHNGTRYFENSGRLKFCLIFVVKTRGLDDTVTIIINY